MSETASVTQLTVLPKNISTIRKFVPWRLTNSRNFISLIVKYDGELPSILLRHANNAFPGSWYKCCLLELRYNVIGQLIGRSDYDRRRGNKVTCFSYYFSLCALFHLLASCPRAKSMSIASGSTDQRDRNIRLRYLHESS
jgi:hypothetical protein